jgi:hypothetical protein
MDNYNNISRHEDAIRALVKHESEVTNNRMIWSAAFHGLLFAALGFCWDKEDTSNLIGVFCTLGIFVSFLNTIGLVYSSKATRQLLIWWHENKPLDYKGPDIIGLSPKNPYSILYYFAPWNLLSMLFMFGWFAIFIINYYRYI